MMTITLKTIKNAHAIYSVKTTFCPTLFYVGMCRLSAINDLPDAKRNSEWQVHVKPDDVLSISILAILPDATEAENFRNVIVATTNPWANTSGSQSAAPASRRVRCVETGAEFPNPSQAARAFGSTRQQMAAHLKGIGRTVAGHTFAYISD